MSVAPKSFGANSTSARTATAIDPQQALRDRYSAAAEVREAALCCPIDYDPKYLKAIPEEVLERDYGCGDPSRYVAEGDTVLDLGSGGGKICFIASQIVGPKGHVIGVDMNDDMLSLARRAEPQVAEALGCTANEVSDKLEMLDEDEEKDMYEDDAPQARVPAQQLQKYLKN